MGYTESRFFGDRNVERARAAWGDRSLPSGGVLFGGELAGHWSRRVEGSGIRVEVVTYRRPGAAIRTALDTEVDRLGAFFERPVTLRIATAR